MLLELGGARFPVDVEDEDSVISKHSGKPLATVEVSLVIVGESKNDLFLSLIERAKASTIASIDENGEVQKHWKIGRTSWHYQDGRPYYSHTIELTEAETLQPSSLSVGNLEIHPYEYEETFQDGALVIMAKVRLSGEQHAAIKSMERSNDSFQVQRHGINETPLQMHFVLCYWSQHGEEYKHYLLLAQDEDEQKPSRVGLTFLWMRALRKKVANNTATLHLLLNALGEKGLLTEEEVSEIHADTNEQWWDTWYDFFRVEEVDKL